MLALLMFGELLLEQVCERVVEAVLLEVGPRDTGRIILRRQIIDFLQFRTILTLIDCRGVTGLGLRRGSGGQCRGGQRHGQAQHCGAEGHCAFHRHPLLYIVMPSIEGLGCSGRSCCR